MFDKWLIDKVDKTVVRLHFENGIIRKTMIRINGLVWLFMSYMESEGNLVSTAVIAIVVMFITWLDERQHKNMGGEKMSLLNMSFRNSVFSQVIRTIGWATCVFVYNWWSIPTNILFLAEIYLLNSIVPWEPPKKRRKEAKLKTVEDFG